MSLRYLRSSISVILSWLHEPHYAFLFLTWLRLIVKSHLWHVFSQIINTFLICSFSHQFGQSGALYSLMLFSLSLCYEVIAHRLHVLSCSSGLACQFTLNIAVFSRGFDLRLNKVFVSNSWCDAACFLFHNLKIEKCIIIYLNLILITKQSNLC